MSRVLWLASACALLIAGCNRPDWSTPVGAYRSFLRALTKGETEIAYGALSTPTRTLLEARAQELARASGGGLKEDPAALLFISAAEAGRVTEVKLVREEGARAVLAVTAPSGTREVTLIREEGGWRIALTPDERAGGSPPPGDEGGAPASEPKGSEGRD